MASNESFLRRFGQAFTDSLHQSMGGLPFWFRIPVGMALHFPQKTSARKRPEGIVSKLRESLLQEDIQSLLRIREEALHLLAEDRLANGGWGKRNNKALRTFFGDLPDDFDTEGSITLTRWVIDAIAFSRLDQNVKARFLDENLNKYLDSRFDREKGASGRIALPDFLGYRPIHSAPRHTASSILCYLGLDSRRFLHCAKSQVAYLLDNQRDWTKNTAEVGHPDILRALILTRLHFYEVDSSDRETIDGSIKEGFTFFWDWLNSPSLIPKQFGPLAHLYLRLYSLSSISDLSIIPGFRNEFSPLESLRRVLRRDVEELCSQRNTNDHRAWGFRALLLWSYLCSPTKEASGDELKDLLLSIIDVGGDFRDGFCVYWAVLFAVADAVVGSDS